MPLKSKKTFEEFDEFYTERIDTPLPEEFKKALQEIQQLKACKNKVPVLEIKDNGRYFLIIPRQRLNTIATRYLRKIEEEQGERMLLRFLRR